MSNDGVKSTDEYATPNAQDESLARWQASLGIATGGQTSYDRPQGYNLRASNSLKISTQSNHYRCSETSKDNKPMVIKMGVEYNISLTFKVNRSVVTAQPYTKNFDSDKAPTGIFYQGSYHVKSCVTDDDKHVCAARPQTPASMVKFVLRPQPCFKVVVPTSPRTKVLPPEIWAKIADHLTDKDLIPLGGLNRPFYIRLPALEIYAVRKPS
ncbi:hypothetical protein H0H93_015875 [Arthromyces matolae]|nr:hypothetical protein H0H93_015875 [Arthromyces matolae]